ncbi:MAG: multiprotein-bridging factor 1 family protein [Agathobacter sp.]
MISKEQLVENFGISMERERLALGYSQQQMAKALQMSLSSYKRILNGETNKIDLYTAFLLTSLTGKQSAELCGILDPLQRARSAMGNLSKSQLDFVSGVIRFELQFAKGLRGGEDIDDYVTLIVPTGNMQDGMYLDTCYIKKVNVAQYRKRYGDAIDCAILITSNHLHPTYVLNDILLISRTPVRDGDTGIFIHRPSGLAYIRKFHQTVPSILEPVSNLGRSFTVDSTSKEDLSQWIKFGRVITKMRSNPIIITVPEDEDQKKS